MKPLPPESLSENCVRSCGEGFWLGRPRNFQTGSERPGDLAPDGASRARRPSVSSPLLHLRLGLGPDRLLGLFLLFLLARATAAQPATAPSPGNAPAAPANVTAAASAAPAVNPTGSPYSPWRFGPPTDPGFFPIAVWLQPPRHAEAYRRAGINTYVGLWRGPTEDQLATLRQAGMRLICDQNEVGRRHLDDPTIIGWMHGDEPDNAQSLPDGQGYGPPIPPAHIQQDYARLRAADPSRPILLNLGQGVAWDGWYGRGVRTNHPEDYPEYIRGGDIISFDIYPAVHDQPAVAGQLWFVAQGVERLVRWTEGRKPVWNCLECTRISNPKAKPTPHQVRAEAWMALIHGSRGLIYFVHEWVPKFNESALLDDPEMLAAVTRLNQRILGLAPVLNLTTPPASVGVTPRDPALPVAVLARQHERALYVFAVAMREGTTTAQFALPRLNFTGPVEVLDEARQIPIRNGGFTDQFEPWAVHLYRITLAADAR